VHPHHYDLGGREFCVKQGVDRSLIGQTSDMRAINRCKAHRQLTPRLGQSEQIGVGLREQQNAAA